MSGIVRSADRSHRFRPDKSPPPGRSNEGCAGGHRDGGGAGRGAPGAWSRPLEFKPASAVVVVVVALMATPIIALVLLIDSHPSRTVLITGIVGLVLPVCLQLSWVAWREELARSRWGGGALLLQAVLVYCPYLWVGAAWVGTPYFLAASTLLSLSRRYAWWAFGAVVVSFSMVQLLIGSGIYQFFYYLTSILGMGLAFFALTRLADLVKELHQTRAELAHLAVTQERLRFARDLHDLLGYSLSAITLKSELVYRLADRQAEKAKEELSSVLELSRQALADVRAVSSSYRQMSLNAECASAHSILAATDIRVRLDVAVSDKLSDAANTVLATVLREGVTNVLRHSKAQHCDITATVEGANVRLTILNDGARPQPQKQRLEGRQGTGIHNLAQRVEILGGSLQAGTRPDGWFYLVARVPLTPTGESAEPALGSGAEPVVGDITERLEDGHQKPEQHGELKAPGAGTADHTAA